MNILSKVDVPTGSILVLQGEKGKLELVSLGDYGKDVNLNKTGAVEDNTPLLPLTDKWVLTISTQYGCSRGCHFCDVPRVGKGVNATLLDLQQQVLLGLKLFPEVTYSNRLNIHYARMGEPTFNPAVLDHARWMKDHIDPEFNVHPVLTTMMPRKNEWLKTMIHAWVRMKNRVYHGNAGLQISLNGTNEDERREMFAGNSLTLKEISELLDECIPVGRKFTLNFPVANWEIRPEILLRYFDPGRFLIKLTPMHSTKTAQHFALKTPGPHADTSPLAYQVIANSLRQAGYDVLVFIASDDEDEGMITCGNAILAETKAPRLREGPLVFIGGSAVGKTPFARWTAQKDAYHTQLNEANILK